MGEQRKQRTSATHPAKRGRALGTPQAMKRRWSYRRRRANAVSSPAKIAANQRNGRRSRGPRTAAGKRRASRNALRHGLAAIGRDNAAVFPDIERRAKAFCNGDTDPLLFEQALIIAENEFILRCVRIERVAAIERMRDPNAIPFTKTHASLARAKARIREAELTYEQLIAAKAKNASENNAEARDSARKPTNNASMSNASGGEPTRQPKPIALRDEFDAMRLAMLDLNRLERYERRAWSRRKRAVRAFIQIRARRND
jgi:hypothetical protein